MMAEGFSYGEIGEKVQRTEKTIERWCRDEDFVKLVEEHLARRKNLTGDLLEASEAEAARVVSQVVSGKLAGTEAALRYKAAVYVLARAEKLLGKTPPRTGLMALTEEEISELEPKDE